MFIAIPMRDRKDLAGYGGRGIVPKGCGVVAAMEADEGARHTTGESGAELDPPACLCLCYAPKWRDSGSRGCGEAERRVQ